jgi:O-antigen/teichoic acid export membrane protein
MGEDALTKIGQGSVIVLLGFGFGTFFQYLYKMILARSLKPEAFGVFTQGLAINQAVATIALLGLNASIPRFMSYYRGRKEKRTESIVSTSFGLLTATSLTITITLFTLSEQIALNIFNEAALTTPLKIFSLAILPLVFIRFFTSFFQGRKKALQKVVLDDFIWSGLLPAFGLGAIVLGYGLDKIVLSYLAATSISALAGCYLYYREADYGLTGDLITKELLWFSWPLFLISVFAIFNRWFDVLMLGWLGASSTAGIYDIAFSIAGYIGFLLEVIGFMFMPVISELYGKKDIQKIRKIYTTVTRWMIIVSLPLLTGALIFTEEIIRLFFSAEYLSGTTPLTFLAVGFLYKVAKEPSEAMLIS